MPHPKKKRAAIFKRKGKLGVRYYWHVVARNNEIVDRSSQGYTRHISARRNLERMHPDATLVEDTCPIRPLG